MIYLFKTLCLSILILYFVQWFPAYSQQPGDLDLTFGQDGLVTTDAGNLGLDDGANVIKQLSDGQLIIAGRTRTTGFPPYQSDLMLAKFLQNGTLAASFGQNGFVVSDLGGASEGFVDLYERDNGHILAAGTSNQVGIYEHLLMQFTEVGGLDVAFGDGGNVYNGQVTSGSVLTSLSVNQQDEFLVTGTANGDVMLAKYAPNGYAVDTFGTSGNVVFDFGHIESVTESAIQTDGKVILAGTQAESGNPEDAIVTRLHPNGDLDLTFNDSGWVDLALSSKNDRPTDLKVLSDGKIMIIGFTTNQAETAFEIFALRLMPDGTYDNSFGSNGVARYDIGSGDDYASAVVLQPDGKAIIGGTTSDGNNSNFCLIRINEDGSLDPTFGNNGVVITEVSSDYDGIADIELQADGKLVVGGTARVGNNDDIALARYHTGLNTSVVEVADRAEISVYPNPATDFLSISAEVKLERIELIDALGRNVLSQAPNALQIQIDISSLPNGIYLLRATDGERMFSTQVMKQ
jgi:uncharacterized delta-60 repeat protein